MLINSSSDSGTSHLVFGPFEFDQASGELRKHGVRLRLQGQPLQILAALINVPGRVISREDFQQQLWQSSTFVDFNHGLNSAMNRLRQVLGDSADQPRYIETLSGRGYRFIAEVRNCSQKPILMVAPETDSATADGTLTKPQATGYRNRKNWLLWITVTTVIASLPLWYLASHRTRTDSAAAPLRFSVSPPDGFALEAGSSRQTFALSPDGARLAFSAMDSSGLFQIFIRDLDTLTSRPLANSVGSYTLFWAPDGRSLFMTMRGSLRRNALDSDSWQVLCDTPALTLSGALVMSNLLISGRSANFVVPISGGTPQALKEMYMWPQVLPDGKHIVYTVFDSRTGHHRARVVRFGEPNTTKDLLDTDSRVLFAPSVLKPDTGYLLFVRAGNILAQPFDPRSQRIYSEPLAVVSKVYSFNPSGAADFSVSNNGMLAYKRYQSRSQLAWVNRRGDVMSTIGPANMNLKQARLSPDGKKIATPIFDVSRGVNDMWVIETDTGAARRTVVGQGLVDNPVWAPDSARLAFSRTYDTTPKLFVRGLGEKDADEALPEEYFQVPTDWSGDGRFIAFTNTTFAEIDNELKGDVWLIDMVHGRKEVRLINTSFHESNPSFSPDGRWLAFTSDESGRSEVYVQAFDAGDPPHLMGERHLVSRDGARSIRWSRDGRELFYLGWNGRVYAVPITLSPKLKTGKPVDLFTISTEARAAIHSHIGFDVSPDGQRFLVPIITSPEKSEIVVIQNWEIELRRRNNGS